MSKRVRFTKDFDYPVKRGVVVAYKVGMEMSVPDPHADAAVAAKAGELLPNSAAAPATKSAG